MVSSLIGALVLLGGVVAVVVLIAVLGTRSQRRTDAALAHHWQYAHASGYPIAYVTSVYQHARNGTKAWITWADGTTQDAWIWHNWPPAGAALVLTHRDEGGYGPHSGRQNVLYVHAHELLDVLPPGAGAAYQRHLNRQT